MSDFTVTIPAGSTSGSESFELTPVDDAVAEGAEEFSIEGSVSGLEVIGAAVTIVDTTVAEIELDPSPLDLPDEGSATLKVRCRPVRRAP